MSRSDWVCQAHEPILQQQTIEGHAVRALYLYVGVADLIYMTESTDQTAIASKDWMAALTRLWDNMVDRKMYVTGGVGAVKQWEGFGIDYFLPQGTDEGGCYSETCASIAVMMFAERLLHLDLDARYADIMELCLYNNVMTAMSLDGKEFTYENQLASSDKDLSERHDWFWCACCPPNLTRLYGSLGGYLWDYGCQGADVFINVHLYTTAKVTFDVDDEQITLEQTSKWPLDGTISFQLSAPTSLITKVRLRLPAWCQGQYSLTPKPATDEISITKGYLTLEPTYVSANASFTLEIHNFAPRFIAPHPYTNQRTLTLARGPMIYCAEDIDNTWETNHFKDIVIAQDSVVEEDRRVFEGTGEEYVVLKTECWQRSLEDWEHKARGEEPGMAGMKEKTGNERGIVFVPYYLRANRGGKGHMRVGLLRR